MRKPSYLPRLVEGRLKRMAKHFKAVLVTGARQVGKSTLLRHAFPKVKALVFDPVRDLHRAREDPDFFLDSFPPPLILDEIQFAPELLPALKRRMDETPACGQYFLTGSQNLGVLRSVSESLAGRVAILHLDGMSIGELDNRGDESPWLSRFLADPKEFSRKLPQSTRKPVTEKSRLVRALWRGSLPGLLNLPDESVPEFLASYVTTYLERDVRTLQEIRNLGSFGRFIGLAGALSGREINHSQIGREVGVSPATARSWLDLLMTTFQWFEHFAWQRNAIKRISGKPKGYLSDSGLACHLQRLTSPEAIAVSPALGSIFETWVAGELRRQSAALTTPPNWYHWRTNGGAEVDLVLERDGMLFPIEVKCKTSLSGHDLSGLQAFRATYGDPVSSGIIVYAGAEPLHLRENIIALPWNW